MKYAALTITAFEKNEALNRVYFHYSDDEAGIELNLHPTIEEGWRLMLQLEGKLGREREIRTNQFDDSITYHELCGFLN